MAGDDGATTDVKVVNPVGSRVNEQDFVRPGSWCAVGEWSTGISFFLAACPGRKGTDRPHVTMAGADVRIDIVSRASHEELAT